MNFNLSRLAGVHLIVLCLATPVIADDNASANRLFVETMSIWNDISDISSDDIETLKSRSAALELMRSNLLQIMEDYPGSDMAVQLIIGENIGPLSVAAVDEKLRRSLTDLAVAECNETPRRDCLMTEALATVRGIEDDFLRLVALAEIFGALVEAGLSAEELGAEALEVARRITDEPYRWSAEWSLAKISATLVEAGLFTEALETAGEITPEGSRARFLARIAVVQEAPELFTEALVTARGIVDFHRKYTLADIGSIQAEAGLFTEALETVREIEDNKIRALALDTISDAQATAQAAAQAEHRLFTEALETASGIVNNRPRAMAIAQIAAAQAEAGLFSEALVTASGIPEARAGIATSQAEAGLFAEALETARNIADDGYQARALASISAAQAEAGLFTEALETARGIADDTYRAQALAQIAAAQPAPELFTDALATARGIVININGDREQALAQIASVMAQAGLISEALETARSIANDSQRAQALVGVALQLPD